MKTVSLTITEAEGRKVFASRFNTRDDHGVVKDGVSSFTVGVHRSVIPMLQPGVEISGYRIFGSYFTSEMRVTVLRIKSIDLGTEDFVGYAEDAEVLVTVE